MPTPHYSSQSYSSEAVQQILNLAIAQQAHQGEFSHQQLVEIAAELGISRSALTSAEQAWVQQQSEWELYQAFNQYRQANLQRHVGRYAIVNVGLFLLNCLTGLSSPWFLYILLLWGLKLGLDIWNVYHTQGQAYENAFRKWRRQHRFRNLIQTWLGRLLNA